MQLYNKTRELYNSSNIQLQIKLQVQIGLTVNVNDLLWVVKIVKIVLVCYIKQWLVHCCHFHRIP